ncbi:MAG: hypothetical protein LBD99_05050 [Candidatus Margulisbacteria bacterium]|jgi:hypothetical protein|nr:hypothetical protein [Candidatus Margulisiibacteriota bacterium]
MPPVSVQIRQFSPLARKAFLPHLGLEDKNGNGAIDRGAGEGYEQFIARYGNADIGFFINGVIQGANNGRLEENEIVNHYYINIRFKNPFQIETNNVERDLTAEIRRSGLPLVWLDNGGTAMNAVNRILGAGWRDRTPSEDEAIRMFQRVINTLNIRGLSGDPNNTGYYTLPEFLNRRTGYCFEIAQFGFWFFSQLRVNAITVTTALKPDLVHAVIKLFNPPKVFDYINISTLYETSISQWSNFNPIQSIGEYYAAGTIRSHSLHNAEKATIYNKYNIPTVAVLMDKYLDQLNPDYNEIIAIGEFILENISIEDIAYSKNLRNNEINDNLERILADLIISYSTTKNRRGFNKIASLLNRYFSNDPSIRPFIEKYRL